MALTDQEAPAAGTDLGDGPTPSGSPTLIVLLLVALPS